MVSRLTPLERPNVIWSIGPWQGRPNRQLTDATNLKASFSLTEYNEASCKISTPIHEAMSVGEGRNDIWIYRNGVHLGRFRVCRPTLSFADRFEGDIIARDYRYLMGLRGTRGTFTYVVPTDQATVIWEVFTNGQSWGLGDLGITQAPGWAATGITRTQVGIKDGDSVWKSVMTLAGLSNGCEPYINPDMTLSLNYPQKGSDTGVILDLIASEQGVMSGSVAKATLAIDYENFANAIRQYGDDGTAPVEAQVPYLANQAEGVWALPIQQSGLTTNQMVIDAAQASLARANTVFPEYRIELREGFWQGPSHIWLGDTVRQIIRAGEYNIDRKVRVYGISIEWKDDGAEKVTLELAKNALTGERKLSQALRNLRALG